MTFSKLSAFATALCCSSFSILTPAAQALPIAVIPFTLEGGPVDLGHDAQVDKVIDDARPFGLGVV